MASLCRYALFWVFMSIKLISSINQGTCNGRSFVVEPVWLQASSLRTRNSCSVLRDLWHRTSTAWVSVSEIALFNLVIYIGFREISTGFLSAFPEFLILTVKSCCPSSNWQKNRNLWPAAQSQIMWRVLIGLVLLSRPFLIYLFSVHVFSLCSWLCTWHGAYSLWLNVCVSHVWLLNSNYDDTQRGSFFHHVE